MSGVVPAQRQQRGHILRPPRETTTHVGDHANVPQEAGGRIEPRPGGVPQCPHHLAKWVQGGAAQHDAAVAMAPLLLQPPAWGGSRRVVTRRRQDSGRCSCAVAGASGSPRRGARPGAPRAGLGAPPCVGRHAGVRAAAHSAQDLSRSLTPPRSGDQAAVPSRTLRWELVSSSTRPVLVCREQIADVTSTDGQTRANVHEQTRRTCQGYRGRYF